MHSPAPCLSLSPYRGVSGTGMNDPRTRSIDRRNNSFSRFKNEMPKWCSRIESPSEYFRIATRIKLLEKKKKQQQEKQPKKEKKKKCFRNTRLARFDCAARDIFHCALLRKLRNSPNWRRTRRSAVVSGEHAGLLLKIHFRKTRPAIDRSRRAGASFARHAAQLNLRGYHCFRRFSFFIPSPPPPNQLWAARARSTPRLSVRS